MEIKIDGSKKIDGNRNRYKWKLSVFFSLATHFQKVTEQSLFNHIH